MYRGPNVKHTDGNAVTSTDNQGGDWQEDSDILYNTVTW